MKRTDLIAGARFVDPNLSQPPEYRLHKVHGLEATQFTAIHLASGAMRIFARSEEVLEPLQLVPSVPLCVANMDTLVGEKVRLYLTDGGKLSGIVTAVRYKQFDLVLPVADEFEVEPSACRYVHEIELDRSGSTSYKPAEIRKIEVL